MNVCFVGFVMDNGALKNFPDASVAGNKMQRGFIDGLKANGVNVEVITVFSVAMWRFNKKPLIIKPQKFTIGGVNYSAVGFLNFPIIKQLIIKRRVKKYLKDFCKAHKSEENVLMVYNTFSYVAEPVIKASKKYNAKSIGIIADLPIKCKKSFIRQLADKRQVELIDKFDALIPLTKLIPKDFAPHLPYHVIDAGCNPEDYRDMVEKKVFESNAKNILYCGSLNDLSGIDLALAAMDLVKRQDVRLYVFGGGKNEKIVKEAAERDNRIKFCGVVDYKTILEMQWNSDLLICPRKSDDYTTKYTFPSKILEYMCAGKPVICNPLPGIDKGYEKYINFPKEESAKAWAELIEKILFLNAEEYSEKAKIAKEFALNNKSWVNECKDLVEFIDSL